MRCAARSICRQRNVARLAPVVGALLAARGSHSYCPTQNMHTLVCECGCCEYVNSHCSYIVSEG